MTDPIGWPDPSKPGYPLNPERDGWHWMETPDGQLAPYEWRAADECERGRWPSYWVSQGDDDWDATECKYIGPCLTPAEVEAKVAAAIASERETCAQIADAWDEARARSVYYATPAAAIRSRGETSHD